MDTKSNDDSGGSDSLDKSMQRKCVMVETTATTTTATNITTEPDNCSRDSATVQQEEDQDHQPSTPGGESAKANNNNNNNITTTATTTAASAAFETKVKLISQNLKETKLAEETGSDEVTTASASSNEQEEVQEEEPSGDRLKKVHFHPDAKESDGGNNRVKKKWKSSQNHGGDGANLGCDGMEMDVTEDEQNADGGENEAAEDEEEEEEEFNLAKTIAEAEDYLKQHPLTFVRRAEQNGELNTKEASQLEQEKMIEGDEDEHHEDNDDEDSEIDFYKNCKPENGIERILGKETKAGKVEFLLRFENQGGLSWESEEFIRCMCPTLLKLYEQNRERRQQRLMHHVAKRQSLRQRYTDF